MAVRITVVVAQAAERHGRMTDYEEQLLTRVMLENSLDAVFVGPLEHMTADGTDALCLSKIPASSVVFGWLPPEAASEHFLRLSLPWARQATPDTPRSTIQYRQIKIEQPIDELMNNLSQLLKNASIKTMQINIPISMRSTKPFEVVPKQAIPEAAATQEIVSRTVEPIRPYVRSDRPSEAQRDELDQLVDDLEAMDL